MNINELLAVIAIWLLPLIAAIIFNSTTPLLGWIGSCIVSYFIIVYESEV